MTGCRWNAPPRYGAQAQTQTLDGGSYAAQDLASSLGRFGCGRSNRPEQMRVGCSWLGAEKGPGRFAYPEIHLSTPTSQSLSSKAGQPDGPSQQRPAKRPVLKLATRVSPGPSPRARHTMPLPHMSFVRGADNVAFLKKRFEALSAHPAGLLGFCLCRLQLSAGRPLRRGGWKYDSGRAS